MSIFSIFGECTGNVRSTPTPKESLRTVKVSRAPLPWRRITTPSKTWVRRRLPSTTWKWTRTRSPAWNAGTRRSWAFSRFSMIWLMAKTYGAARWSGARAAANPSRRGPVRLIDTETGKGSDPFSPFAALLEAPFADLGVVARQQDLRHRMPAPNRGARVVRVL